MRRLRKKLKKPRSPWDSSLIEEEKKILNDYGLRRKREILKARAILRNFRRRARSLIAERNEEAEGVLLDKLANLGLLQKGQGLDDALAMTVNNILDRRLQTIVFRKGLAKTPKQARQIITHGHLSIKGRRMVYPSYMIPVDEEGKINIKGGRK